MTLSRTLGAVAALACFATMDAHAASVKAPNPKDLTQGMWELNHAKSKFCGTPLKKSTRYVRDIGWDMVLVTWDMIRADGQPELRQYVYRYDGDKYPGGGIEIPAIEAISWKLIDPNHVEFVHWSKDNKKTGTYTRTVSADGQTLTQNFKSESRPCEESQVFDRLANPK